MHKLTIQIAPGDLEGLSALGLRIALSAATVDENPAGVVWKSIGLIPTNEVTWDRAPGFYAMPTPPKPGGVATSSNSNLPGIVSNAAYDLSESLVFSGPTSASGAGVDTYAVDIRYTAGSPITVGLMQDLTVNGTSCPKLPFVASAASSPFRSTFQPLDLAYLSLRSDAVDGRIFRPSAAPTKRTLYARNASNAVLGPLTRLDFASLGSVLVAIYEPTTGQFRVSVGT